MKKILIYWLCTLLSTLTLTACNSDNDESVVPNSPDDSVEEVNKVLIVYFSWGGNTRAVAKHIHDLTGADMIEVETVIPYPESYEDVIKIAPDELANDYRPELKTKVDNMDEYDTLIVGTPIWGGHLAPAMKSFLASYDLKGKYIAPFCTHGGSGTANSVNDIRSVSPDSNILESMAIYGSRAETSRNEVEKWLLQIGIIKQQ